MSDIEEEEKVAKEEMKNLIISIMAPEVLAIEAERKRIGMRPEEAKRRIQEIIKNGEGQVIIDPKKKPWQDLVVAGLKERSGRDV